MSFILKALQKLEEENAARPAEPAAIESAILVPSSRSADAHRRTLKWLAIALVFLAGGAITYLLMPKTPIPVVPQKGMATAPAPAVSLQPAAPSEPARPAAPIARVDGQPAKPAPAAGEISPSATSSTGSPPAAVRNRTRFAGEKHDAGATAAAVPPPSSVAAEAPTTQLAVNGIAFQDDPAASAAVVNGMYVKRGMTVGGARVERIFQDKVRFTSEGRTFEVPLAK